MTKEALKLALEALEEAWYHVGTFQPTEKAIDLYDEARTAIKEALAQTEQEPVAIVAEIHMSRYTIEWTNGDLSEGTKLYTTPPQRTWVGLTDEEKASFWTADQMTQEEWDELFAAIETKLREKNA